MASFTTFDDKKAVRKPDIDIGDLVILYSMNIGDKVVRNGYAIVIKKHIESKIDLLWINFNGRSMLVPNIYKDFLYHFHNENGQKFYYEIY